MNDRAQQPNPQTIFENYDLARKNDVKGVMALCDKHPHIIHLPFSFLPEIDYIGMGSIFTGGFSGAIAIIAATGNVVTEKTKGTFLERWRLPAFLGSVSLLSSSIATYRGYTRHEIRRRDGRMLLDFAAEGGATDVMLALIARGADVTDKKFLDIAKLNGREAFIATFHSVMDAVHEKSDLQTECARLLKKHQGCEADLDKEIDFSTEVCDKYERLLHDVKNGLDEPISPPISAIFPAIITPASSFKPTSDYPFGLYEKAIPFDAANSFLTAFMANDDMDRLRGLNIEDVRKIIQKELRGNQALYSPSEVNGSNVEIQAFCNLFKVCVVLFDRREFNQLHQSLMHAVVAATAGKTYGRKYTNPETYSKPPIILGQVGQDHYVPLAERGRGSAADRCMTLSNFENFKRKYDDEVKSKTPIPNVSPSPTPALPAAPRTPAAPSAPKTLTSASVTAPLKITPSSLFKYAHAYPFGLSEKDIPFLSGDCFFNAFMALDDQKRFDSVAEARKAVRDELFNNRTYYEVFAADAVGDELYQSLPDGTIKKTIITKYEDICDHVAEPQAWMDNIAIEAFCRAYQVCVVTIDHKKFKGQHQSMTHAIVAATSEKIFGREYANPETYSHPPVILGYVRRGHYVPLVFKGNKCESGSERARSEVLTSIEGHKKDYDVAFAAANAASALNAPIPSGQSSAPASPAPALPATPHTPAASAPSSAKLFKPIVDYPFGMTEQKSDPIPGDCFFDSVKAFMEKRGIQLFDKTMDARNAIAKYLKDNRTDYEDKDFLANGFSIDPFCDQVVIPCYAVGNFEIEAFCEAYGVRVVSIEEKFFRKGIDTIGSNPVKARSLEAAGQATTIYTPKNINAAYPPILLGYTTSSGPNGHYATSSGHYVPLDYDPILFPSGSLQIMERLEQLKLQYNPENVTVRATPKP